MNPRLGRIWPAVFDDSEFVFESKLHNYDVSTFTFRE